MNDKQKEFLIELAALFEKYGIDEVCIGYESNHLIFASMGESLRFRRFINGKFENIHTDVDSYEPNNK